ncbi:GNAT family protein [Sphingomonas sp. 1P06PA]|uniref:GNAT family N-acetyltransferase n=1 Tax=Sphingomonas sp. 1P06PA TaxID=554121 RepID=UPI0039A66F97
MRDALHVALAEADTRLDPLLPADREPLRAATGADEAIWPLYPTDWSGPAFDTQFDKLLADPLRLPFAIREDGVVVGMTAYIVPDLWKGIVEIGNSYILPAARGTGLNDRVKRLMIDHAFAAGIRRIEFRVDERNGRSQAAVLKLGCVKEGVMRQERITWTGHVRDTALFSLLIGDWRGRHG